MKIIAGLGNPGLQYAATRHNCGFMTIDQIADQLSVAVSKKESDCLTGVGIYRGEKLLLAKPQAFMNLSGFPLSRLAGYYKVDLADILIVSDDLDLPCGTLRLKRSGRDGGHNGWKSIIEQFGSMQINRIKIGIGSAPYDTADYVLGRFSSEEMPVMAKTLRVAAEAALFWAKNGIGEAMNKYNGMDLVNL